MGALSDAFPDLPNPVWEAIKVCKQAFNARQSEHFKSKPKG